MDLVSVSNAGAPPPAAGQSITSIPVVQVVTSQPAAEFSAPTVTTMRVVKPVVVATGTATGQGQVNRPQLVSVVRGQTIGPNGKGQARALPVVKMPLGSMAAVTSSMFVIRPRQPSPEPTQAEVEAFRARSLADPATIMPGQTIGAEEDCQTTLQEFVPEASVLDPETGLLVPAPQPPQPQPPPQSGAQPHPSQAPEVQLHPSMLVSQPPVVVHPEVVYQLEPSSSLAETELHDSPAATSYSAASSQEPLITLSCGSSYAAAMGKALAGDSSQETAEHTQDTAEAMTEDTDAFDNTLTIDSAAVAVAGDEDGDEDDVPLASRKRKTPGRGRGRPRKRPRSSSAAKPPPAQRAPPPFNCDDCEEQFADRLALAAHERQHGNEKHTCVECRQTFAYPLALRRHKLRHGKAGRPRTGRRRTKAPSRYVDADWGEVGIGRSRSGARSEEMVTCGVCDEELAPEDVADHIAPPSGITYFRCEQCGGAFGQRCQLSRHGCHSGGNRRRGAKGGKVKTNTRVAAPLAVVMKREASEEEAEEDVDEPQDDTGTEWEGEEGADSIADSAAGEGGDGDAGGDDPLSLVLDIPTEGGGGDGHLTCDVCQINFVSKRNLMRHRAQHQGGTRYSCEVCEQSYARLDDLSRHTRSVHNQKRQYKCTRCTRSFTQKRIVTYHMRSHDVAKDTKGPKKEPVMDDGTDYPGPGPVKYTCEVCGAGFDTRRRYTRHQQLRHDAESPKYECEVCNATYARIDELTRHTIQVHHQKKTVPCPRCTRLFTQQRIVDYHVRGHDTKRVYNLAPRPYKCEECDRSFRTEELLTDHICRTKTSVTRCVCDICGRGISCPQALRRHRLQHNEERPAKCQTCGAAFIDDVALSKHVLTHSEEKPFLCDHCGKGFRFKDYLVRHTRFHTGEKPYQCSACDKSFATSDTLNRHYLIHTGEKPYVCEICARPFRQAQQLKTHMKVHRKREIPYLDHDSREEAQTFDLRHADVTVPGNCSDVRFLQDERGEVTFVEEVCGEVTETTVLDVQMTDEQTRSDLRLVGNVAGQV